jgi:flagellar basal-body rod protein FlgG
MSVQTLYTAATGMTALQTKLEIIANNMANINTVGFKRDRANFEDLFYVQDKLPGAQDSAGNYTPTGLSVGLGARVSGVQTDYTQGGFQTTNRQLDLAIEGIGFFQVRDQTGEIMYSRAGNFGINSNGQLVVGSAQTGRLVEPPINIPVDTMNISVSAEGIVEVQQANNTQLSQVGQLQLAQFINNDGLMKVGENLYRETISSGNATLNNPGTNGVGYIRQGTLESSNVEPVAELIDLITTQRAFELNSQTIQAGDQIMQLVANLRRF